MPTEGRVRTRVTRTQTAPRKKQVKEPPAPHRVADWWGVGLLGLGLVLLVVLAFGQGGLLGGSLVYGVRLMVGHGAWVVASVLCFVGFTLLAGRSPAQATRVSIGSALMFLGALAIFAGSHNGDFFDPQAVTGTGGYLGAVAGWLLQTLLGAAKPVGIVILLAVGAVFCLEIPLREAFAEATRKALRKPKPVDAELVEEEELPAPAVVRARNRRSSGSEAAEAQAAVKPIPSWLKTAMEGDGDSSEAQQPAPISQPPARKEPKIVEAEASPFAEAKPRSSGSYTLPPLSLLAEAPAKAKKNPQDLQKNIEILEGTLDQFGVEANVVEVATGPSLTRYEIQLGPGIHVKKIVNLAENIAMSLAAHHVRVEAPIPGKAAIGVEVPNPIRTLVTLREMCDSLEFHDNAAKLNVALGKDVAGTNRYADLTKMPHVLIGGATNSGKSIGMSSIIMSLIMRHTPKEVRLIMIDPKRVELSLFEGLPHLMCPVVKDVEDAAGVLRAVVREMEKRIGMFEEKGVRNIDGWNSKAEPEDKLPYIVVFVDELADLMIQCRAQVEVSIHRLAQLARATGIHLVIATQRPSVDVITGTIKANISSRIAFAVSSVVDSRTILDAGGADKLLGKGDMLYHPIDALKAIRIQGCYVSEKEIEDVCTFWRRQDKPLYVLNPIQIAIEEREAEMKEEEESDPMWPDAVRFVVETGKASTSNLQRRFSIGFQRASRLLDLMESRGIVGPRDGSRPRDVLVDPVRAEQLLGNRQYETPMDPSEYIGDDD